MSSLGAVDKVSDRSDYADSASSEYSFSGTSQSVSPRASRRSYKRVDTSVKSTSDYVDKRFRNNAAVHKFRSRSKTDSKVVERDISTYSSLTKLFEEENIRLEESTQTLQALLCKHYHGADMSEIIYQVINSEATARENFLTSVNELESTLSDHHPKTPNTS